MKVQCLKRIHAGVALTSTFDIMLERIFDLPFPPHIDIAIQVKRMDYKDLSEDIVFKEIYWQVESSSFLCYAYPDNEIYNAVQNHYSHRTVEEVAEGYIKRGWTKV